MGSPDAFSRVISPRLISPRLISTPTAMALLLVLIPFAVGQPGWGQSASHAIKIKVEETTRIELGEDLEVDVKQGGSEQVSTSYSVSTNSSSSRTIEASAEIDGDPSGVELSAHMQAPGGESISQGKQVLVAGGEGKTKTLVEALEAADASEVDLTYFVSSASETPPGTVSVSVSYTITEN